MNALTVARFTIQEAIRRRLILAGLLLSLAFLGLYTLGFSFLYGRAAHDAAARPTAEALTLVFASTVMTTLGLYAIHFLSSFIALFLTVGSISGEIDAGTLHAVLARPMRRADFVLGRWVAQATLISIYVGAMAGALIMIARLVAGYEVPDAGRAIGLMILGSILLLTVSLFGSTLMSTLANGVVVFSLFGLAWLAGIIEFLGGLLTNQGMINIGITVSLLVPSDATWRAASYYIQSPAFLAVAASRAALPFASISPPSTPFLVWAAVYPIIFLGLAVVAFSRRDL
jgi:Cu-processing system permease protein